MAALFLYVLWRGLRSISRDGFWPWASMQQPMTVGEPTTFQAPDGTWLSRKYDEDGQAVGWKPLAMPPAKSGPRVMINGRPV